MVADWASFAYTIFLAFLGGGGHWGTNYVVPFNIGRIREGWLEEYLGVPFTPSVCVCVCCA